MSANEQEIVPETTAKGEETTTPEVADVKTTISKYAIRKQVWTHCEINGLVTFPRPLRGRAPNFHGAPDAAAKLAELELFQKASCVRVNADKPQETVRILTLEKGKKLLVPASRTKSAVGIEVVAAEGASKSDLKKAASRNGMLDCGKPVPLDTDLKIDVLVMGSVAVSRDGRRIGRGEGFGDLEFALLTEIGAVTEQTVVVTTVHESQVLDSLPAELFQPHDVPVDVIVTPTEVIYVKERAERPSGVLWSILSQRKMDAFPVLKQLRDKLVAEGKECHLKEEDTDSETERTRRRLHHVHVYQKFPRRRPRSSAADTAAATTTAAKKERASERNGLVSFPRPLRGRVPNFHGAPDAAAKLAELELFQKASCVRVNADKPQETVRILTLEKGKKLLVPASRTKSAVGIEVVAAEGASKSDLKKAASRNGMLDCGKPVPLDTDLKIDVLVMGSVAVSRDGRRIGRGEGFGDLEFALLTEIGAVTEQTVVVTTVHESQVLDSLPAELFQPHDVPVDVIVTPTEVIYVKERAERPSGVLWSILSQRKMDAFPVLKQLRDKLVAEGKECHLKEEDTDSETERTRRRLHHVQKFLRFRRKPLGSKSESEDKPEKTEGDKKKRKTTGRRFDRRRAPRKSEGEATGTEEPAKVKEHRKKRVPRMPMQFSLRVANITSNVRVRDLKNALAERNVKPTDITWRGYRGFAFLHFAKPKAPEEMAEVDTIVASLQDMKVTNLDEGVTLLVEPAKPMGRIETTAITAV